MVTAAAAPPPRISAPELFRPRTGRASKKIEKEVEAHKQDNQGHQNKLLEDMLGVQQQRQVHEL